MTMLSWRERAMRRGGMTQSEFLHNMRVRGFNVIADTLAAAPLFAFVHWTTNDRRYEVRPGESFRRAHDRMVEELHGATTQ